MVTLKRKVSRLEKANETHVHDDGAIGTLGSSPISSSYPCFVMPLACPLQGDTVFQRQGSEIYTSKLTVKGSIFWPINVLAQSQVRVIVWMDKNQNGATSPTFLTTTNGFALLDNAQTADIALMPFNILTAKRYTILYNKVFVNNPSLILDYDPVSGNTSTVASKSVTFEFSKIMRKKIMFANTNNGDGSDIISNGIWYAIMQDAPVSGNPVNYSCQSRLEFSEA